MPEALGGILLAAHVVELNPVVRSWDACGSRWLFLAVARPVIA